MNEMDTKKTEEYSQSVDNEQSTIINTEKAVSADNVTDEQTAPSAQASERETGSEGSVRRTGRQGGYRRTRTYGNGSSHYNSQNSSQANGSRNDTERQQGSVATSEGSASTNVRPVNQNVPQQAVVDNRPLEERSLMDLNIYARRLGIVGATLMSKEQLIEK